MPRVYNWQIGREMEYRFQTGTQKRQFAAVFNINRCIACQTCTMACKSTWTFSPGQELMWWNNVETKPFGGYPHHWDTKLLALQEAADPGGQVWDARPPTRAAPYGTFAGKTIFETADGIERQATGYIPDEDEWKSPNLFEDTATRFSPSGASLPEHSGWFFYLQRICNHCTYPACVAACPRNAAYKREEDGIVLIDQERCRGYRKCVEACPYKKAMYRPTTRTSEKCIGCYPRVEGTDPLTEGVPMETRCMTACIGKIRLQGLVKVEPDGQWAEDRQNPLYYLVHVEKVALPLYPQFGTQPNVYTSRPAGSRAITSVRCSAPASTRRSNGTPTRPASSSPSSSSSGQPRKSSSPTASSRVRRLRSSPSMGRSAKSTTTPSSASTARARRSSASPSTNRSMSGRTGSR